MDYFRKIEENLFQDLYWNLPEVKQGKVNVVGGNGQSFRTPVRVAEYLGTKFPIQEVGLGLPDSLRGKIPEVPGLKFLKATVAGSFEDTEELAALIDAADYSILAGDLSRNAVTLKAVSSAVHFSEKPLFLTRDAIDAIAEKAEQTTLMRENLVLVATMAQLVKLLRAIYYPKMLLLSQSLTQVSETLHKFTLSYPTKIVTLHNGQILIAENGQVVAVPLEKSGFSPLTIWGGEFAAKILALNLYNPGNFIGATVAGIFKE